MKSGCTWPMVGLSVVLAGLLAGCEAKQEELAQKTAYTGPLVESNNVLIIFSDSAKLQAKITAPLQQQFENGDMVFPKSLKITFYGDNGQRVINTLSGKYGKYDKNQNLFTVRGKVKVRNEEKRQQLKTEELFFNRQKGTIYTDKAMAVRVETDTEVLTGFGLQANQEFSWYKILNPTGVFTVQQPDQK